MNVHERIAMEGDSRPRGNIRNMPRTAAKQRREHHCLPPTPPSSNEERWHPVNIEVEPERPAHLNCTVKNYLPPPPMDMSAFEWKSSNSERGRASDPDTIKNYMPPPLPSGEISCVTSAAAEEYQMDRMERSIRYMDYTYPHEGSGKDDSVMSWPLGEYCNRELQKPFYPPAICEAPRQYRNWSRLAKRFKFSDKDMPCAPNFLPAYKVRYIERDGLPLCIGEGTYGEVYVASLEGVKKPVCVKVFVHRGYAQDRRIMVEAARLTALNTTGSTPWCHGIVGVKEGVGYNRMAIVMDLIGDPSTFQTLTLYDLLCEARHNPGNLPEPVWADFNKELARKIQNVHQRGIIINDIKWDNIMLQWDQSTWRPVLIDMGNARYKERTTMYHLPPEGLAKALKEIPQLAPELYETWRCQEKSDVYSLGAVICFIGDHIGCDALWCIGDLCRLHRLEDRPDLNNVIHLLDGLSSTPS